MIAYKTGQAVLVDCRNLDMTLKSEQENIQVKPIRFNGPATILYEDKDPGFWSVLYKEKDSERYTINRLHHSNIKPYKNNCWSKGCDGKVDSSQHPTCDTCHWVICTKCGRCKVNGCESKITIKQKPLRIKV